MRIHKRINALDTFLNWSSFLNLIEHITGIFYLYFYKPSNDTKSMKMRLIGFYSQCINQKLHKQTSEFAIKVISENRKCR